jgi:hypothetical protein
MGKSAWHALYAFCPAEYVFTWLLTWTWFVMSCHKQMQQQQRRH